MALLRCISALSRRFYSAAASTGLRASLQNEIKAAMKNRDTNTSTILRSVMSEINSAEKASNDELSSSTIAGIVRKAIQRRTEAALKFSEASRADLAEKEHREADILSKFLPPLLSSADIDAHVKAIVDNLPAGTDLKKSSGFIFKEFYSRVDKSTVDPNLVKERTQNLVNARTML
ncbi:GatB YqeY domain-containing protein [Gymnopilus junonius]|uniref:Altered inheritance of mitochondria protein 41 n=1 Tax=Gymnopilus junonius TaxID=109634 RepID=A0A9P5NLX2_GYMJU|nr:GatB YqeY domain-containing protein [Gymnopilus junonius]